MAGNLNPFWTLEYADAAMLAEAEVMNEKPINRMKAWPLSEIERECELYRIKDGMES